VLLRDLAEVTGARSGKMAGHQLTAARERLAALVPEARVLVA
jgi:hypothetical protein